MLVVSFVASQSKGPLPIERLKAAPTFGCPGLSWVTREDPSESWRERRALPLHGPELLGTSAG